MRPLLTLPALLMLTSCGTTTTEFIRPEVGDELRVECEPRPNLQLKVGDEMRQALLQNRAESKLVHAVCSDRLKKVLNAVGVEPLNAKPKDRWSEFQLILKGLEK